MNDQHHKDHKADVLLRVDSQSISVISIDLAVAMAASVETRLHGLFIENQDLLRAASLPFTREISFTTAEEKPIDYDQMQLSLRTMAAQFRQSLEKAARASQISCSFDYVSGQARDAMLALRSDNTYTIVGQRSASRVQTAVGYASVRRVLLIENHSPHLMHALDVVLRRFSQHRIEITAVVVDDSARLDLQDKIELLGQRVTLVELRNHQLDDLLVTRAVTFDCAILSKHEDMEVQQLILKQLNCPVILVS